MTSLRPKLQSSACHSAWVVLSGALLLAACQKADNAQQTSGAPIAALALATTAPPAPAAFAPAAAALPAPASPVRYRPARRTNDYAYVERAYAMNRAFGDTPPDYTVDYDGTRPWIWRANNGAYRVVEQLPQGQRYYYYQAGASNPFYVSDPEGGYAYDGGELVGVYAPDGSPIDDYRARAREAEAARYYARSQALYQAANNQERHAAYASEWRQRHDYLVRQQQAWDDQRARDAQWSAWHDEHRQDVDQPWQQERDHRQAYAVAIGAAALVGAATILTLGHDHGDHQTQNGRQAGPMPVPPQGSPQGPPSVPHRDQVAPIQGPPSPAPRPMAQPQAKPSPRPATSPQPVPQTFAPLRQATPPVNRPAPNNVGAEFRQPSGPARQGRVSYGPASVGNPATVSPVRAAAPPLVNAKIVEPRPPALQPRPSPVVAQSANPPRSQGQQMPKPPVQPIVPQAATPRLPEHHLSPALVPRPPEHRAPTTPSPINKGANVNQGTAHTADHPHGGDHPHHDGDTQ